MRNKFLWFNVILIWCVLILGGIHVYFKYRHDQAVTFTERANLDLGLKNVSETNDSIADDMRQVRDDVKKIADIQDGKIDKLVSTDQTHRNLFETIRFEFGLLREILDYTIGLESPPKEVKEAQPH